MTLGEVMIASSVLLVCLTSLAGVLGMSVNSSRMARVRDEAANLANAKIEYARSLAYDQVGLRYDNGLSGDPAGEILTPEQVGSFTVVTECSWVRTGAGRAAYKKLVVRVSWQQPSAGQVEVTTMIYGKSEIVASGDLVVRLRYRESAAPVVNATVAIRTVDNAVRSVLTDSGGEAFFGQAAVGAVAISVVPPAGCIVDTSTISSAAISGDALATLIVYVQQPAQALVRVTDTAGAPVSGAAVTLRRADGAVLAPVSTDGSGEARFSGLLFSDYTASVALDGYAASSVPFVLNAGANQPTVPVTISHLAGVGLRVRVFDVNGTPVPAALVTLRHFGDNGIVQQGTAGTNGEFAFASFGEGAYDVTAEKTSYVSQVKQVSLNDGQSAVVDVQLSPAVYKGNMSITARDKNGHLRAIQLIVSGAGYYRNDLWTDNNGHLSLTDLIAGTYQVQCYSNPASIATVIINGGQTAEVSVSQSK